jgi:hypothetical protein
LFFFFFGKDSRVLVKHVNKINKLKKNHFLALGGCRRLTVCVSFEI